MERYSAILERYLASLERNSAILERACTYVRNDIIYRKENTKHCLYYIFYAIVSVKHPPPLCFGVPGLKYFARVCLEFYNINLQTKQVCARLAGILDLWVGGPSLNTALHHFEIHIRQS